MFKFQITGVVQGVGFRPYIYNQCVAAGLKGYVKNTGEGVDIVVDDEKSLRTILKTVPAQARIDSCIVKECSGVFTSFEILDSEGAGHAEIPPDTYLCTDCLKELQDKRDRRFDYFFITCTNCGPRYSITMQAPYDRKRTTMSEFTMCNPCRVEYTNPSNRRYHAQTIACHQCGPTIEFYVDGKKGGGIEECASAICDGKIVAIKGVGGFHLVCLTRDKVVKNLRTLSNRKDKPFAVMCKDLTMVHKIAKPTPSEITLLESPERAIVLIKKKASMNSVTELDTIGIMLPYTALHYLLFDLIDEPLVMTSSNMTDEPISSTASAQTARHILDHTRVIHNNIDDSVVKMVGNKTMLIRRSRGYVPRSVRLPKTAKETILCLGAEMNSAFSIVKGDRAYISPYLGNTSNLKSFEHYKKTLDKFLEMMDVVPSVILRDLHPEYNTSLYAATLSKQFGARIQTVQHHRAHAFGAAAEHGLNDFVAIVCDGLGYGDDGTIWGGEVFHNAERVGHLEEQLLLGGDLAAQNPSRMLFSILSNWLSPDLINDKFPKIFEGLDVTLLRKQYDQAFNSVKTSSCGRVLDAVAALLGLCNERTYDGRPAMMLESASTTALTLEPVLNDNILQTTELFKFLVNNNFQNIGNLAATVQAYLAKGLYEIAKQYNLPILFTGGCAYNTIMSLYLMQKGTCFNKEIPAGDGGVCYGQAACYLADPRNNIS